MKTALVTGAGGFMGKALCRTLKEKGIRVIGAVREGSLIDEGITALSISDIRKTDIWKGSLTGIDIIYHLAGCAHGVKGGKYDQRARSEELIYSTNVDATLKLFEEAVRAGVKRFVYVSSIKAVGEESGSLPLNEQVMPAPQDAYGRSKLEAEWQLAAFAKHASIELTILRPPLVYGPGVKGNFYSLLGLAYSGLPLPFKGIKAKRSMIYIGNLMDALYLCGIHPKAKGETFHVRDDRDVTIATLIRMIRTSMGQAPRLFPFPLSVLSLVAKLMHRQEAWARLSTALQIDDKKLHKILGWQPTISLETGIQHTVEWYLNSMKR